MPTFNVSHLYTGYPMMPASTPFNVATIGEPTMDNKITVIKEALPLSTFSRLRRIRRGINPMPKHSPAIEVNLTKDEKAN